jgi:hypothetical protein
MIDHRAKAFAVHRLQFDGNLPLSSSQSHRRTFPREKFKFGLQSGLRPPRFSAVSALFFPPVAFSARAE